MCQFCYVTLTNEGILNIGGRRRRKLMTTNERFLVQAADLVLGHPVLRSTSPRRQRPVPGHTHSGCKTVSVLTSHATIKLRMIRRTKSSFSFSPSSYTSCSSLLMTYPPGFAQSPRLNKRDLAKELRTEVCFRSKWTKSLPNATLGGKESHSRRKGAETFFARPRTDR